MINPLEHPIDFLDKWGSSRAWDLYRFSSPATALVVQFASRPFKKKLAAKQDKALRDVGIAESTQRNIALRITKDWDLQVSYFATTVTAFFSTAAITHAFSEGSGLFALTIGGLVLIAIWLYPRIFSEQLGRVSTPFTQAGAKTRFQRWLVRRNWSEADFYSRLLIVVNLILIILIAITMPAKGTNP